MSLPPVQTPAGVEHPPRLEAEHFRWPEERRQGAPGGEVVPPHAPPGWEQWGQRIGVGFGIAFALWIYFAATPAGLTEQAKTALAVFVFCVTLWITNALPYGVTGLLGIALLGLSGGMKPSDAYSAFGSSAIFFLIGIFLIAGALVETGLSKRCALLFLRRFEGSPYAFAFGMMLAGCFATIWMPNQATTAMLFPIAMEVAVALRLRPKQSNYAKVLFFSMAWGAMVGSNASFLGSSRAALALGMLQTNYGVGIGFMEWMAASFPIVLLGIISTPIILHLVFRREEVEFASARRVLERSVASLGPMQRPQYITLVVLLLTVAAWVSVGGRKVDLAVIALLGAAALFVTGVLKWEKAERYVYWNIILMYGGAIALGAALVQSGAAQWLLTGILGDIRPSPYMAIAGTSVVALVLSEFMSNAAALAVILPLAFTMANQIGASPVALVLATSFGSGLDFIFPISTAPNTIIFASGYLKTSDFVKAGLVMTIASILILLLVIRYWWPLIGLT